MNHIFYHIRIKNIAIFFIYHDWLRNYPIKDRIISPWLIFAYDPLLMIIK